MKDSYSTFRVIYYVSILIVGVIIVAASSFETFDSNRHALYIILGSIFIFSSGVRLVMMRYKSKKETVSG